MAEVGRFSWRCEEEEGGILVLTLVVQANKLQVGLNNISALTTPFFWLCKAPLMLEILLTLPAKIQKGLISVTREGIILFASVCLPDVEDGCGIGFAMASLMVAFMCAGAGTGGCGLVGSAGGEDALRGGDEELGSVFAEYCQGGAGERVVH